MPKSIQETDLHHNILDQAVVFDGWTLFQAERAQHEESWTLCLMHRCFDWSNAVKVEGHCSPSCRYTDCCYIHPDQIFKMSYRINLWLWFSKFVLGTIISWLGFGKFFHVLAFVSANIQLFHTYKCWNNVWNSGHWLGCCIITMSSSCRHECQHICGCYLTYIVWRLIW